MDLEQDADTTGAAEEDKRVPQSRDQRGTLTGRRLQQGRNPPETGSEPTGVGRQTGKPAATSGECVWRVRTTAAETQSLM